MKRDKRGTIVDLEMMKEKTQIRVCDHCGNRKWFLHATASAECCACGAYVCEGGPR